MKSNYQHKNIINNTLTNKTLINKNKINAMNMVNTDNFSSIKNIISQFHNKYEKDISLGKFENISSSDIKELLSIFQNKQKISKEDKNYIHSLSQYFLHYFEEIIQSGLSNNKKGDLYLFISKSISINNKKYKNIKFSEALHNLKNEILSVFFYHLYLHELSKDECDDHGNNHIFINKNTIDEDPENITENQYILDKGFTNKGLIINKFNKKVNILEENVMLIFKNELFEESEMLIYLFFINIFKNFQYEAYTKYHEKFLGNIEKNHKVGNSYSIEGKYRLRLSELMNLFLIRSGRGIVSEEKIGKDNEIKELFKKIMIENQQNYSSSEFHLLTILRYYFLRKD